MLDRVFKVPLAKLGPSQEDFTQRSSLHGPSHACRVQAYTVLLSWKTGLTDELPAAFCAGFLHDLSRRHDGICPMHGTWAVEEKLERYLPFFYELGLTPDRVAGVKTAVANHCVREDPERSHPHFNVTALLKDADALDRWRIWERPSDSFLRLPATAGLVARARELFLRTRELETFDAIWKHALELFGDLVPAELVATTGRASHGG
ncbi:MAG: HD domain-containing protein [Myxococcales bacterium]